MGECVDDWLKPINDRAGTVAEKPVFRSALEKCRYLVQADGFYECKGPFDLSSVTPTPNPL